MAVAMFANPRVLARSVRARWWLLCVAFAACTCSTDLDRPELQKLRHQRQAWGDLRIAEYEMVLRRGCFCDPALLDPVRLVVTGGRTLELTRVSDGARLPVDSTFFLNVDQLFQWLEDYLHDSTARVGTLEYDPQYFFPTHVQVYRQGLVDTDQNIDVSDFSVHWINLTYH
jgi:hypothetical protein